MKVMELCLSDGVGGLELYALRTARELAARGADCIAVVGESGMLSERMPESGVRTLRVRRSRAFMPLLVANRLARIIDREAVDVVHMHWGKDLTTAVLAKTLARWPVKLVYTRQMMITRPKHDIYHRFLYRHVDLFLTITDQLLELAREYLPLPSASIRRLYYGVDAPPTDASADRVALRTSLGVRNPQQFVVGLVGRIEEGKGQHVLIDALGELKAEGVSACAVIVGPKMTEAWFERLVQQSRDLGLADEVVFYGAHPNPTQIMPAFDVVVLTTKKETFGLVLIEAMRSGVAVIGTDAGGVPEIIDHDRTGLLVTPGSAHDLAEKLRALYEDEGYRKRLAQAGKEKADRLFSTESHYAQLFAYLNELVTT
ncbi:MAG: glycosyltransferase family 4 protein [Pseudomonadota bacterium]|nr:MAG: glycosyltransferase family 4 protein [Pseudomonadota bacterium]